MTHDIWRTLIITNKVTSLVKKKKMSLLVHLYDLFKMDDNESIKILFDWFNEIINGFKALGKSYSYSELVRKILWSLLKAWAPINNEPPKYF